MKELLFGCPGIPASTEPHNTLNGIKRVRELGLDAMEFEFVRSVHVKKTDTELLKVWKEFNINGIVIPESPNIEKDGILLQKTWKCL